MYLQGASCIYSRMAPVLRMCMCHVAGQQPMQGQYLTPDLERLLLAACWCVRKLARYTMYVPWVEVAVPQAAMLAALELKGLHCKL